ncbi:MAG: hypothetical protein ACFB10_25120 [Salibacteraceae bacterium]
MPLNRLSWLPLLVLLFLASVSQGQITIKKFTQDSTIFLEEVTTLLTDSRKKEGKDFIEQFTPVWHGGVFTEQERKEVYRICDFMLKKKMRPFPDFESFLFSLISFKNSKQPPESFKAWISSLETLIDGRSRRKFTDYLSFCNNLFSENLVFSSATTKWQSDSRDYSFEIDKGRPKIVFPSLRLACYAKGDSSVIQNTSGVYFPIDKKWIGKGGKVTWERAGFKADQVFAELNNYVIETKRSTYTADSVVITNTIYFDQPLIGKLSERVLANVKPEKASFPKFDSYSKRLKITNLIPSLDYDGGFAQYGAKFIGSGNEERLAQLIIKRHDKPFLIAASIQFTIRVDRIVSRRAQITIRLDQDSIVHPGLSLRLLTNERRVTLIRENEGVSKSPYFNTYHQIDMFFEALYWNIDDPIIKLGPIPGSSDRTALFESDEYYREYRFDRLQGLEMTHPLVRIKDCAVKYDTNFLSARDVSFCMKISESQARPMLMKLSNQGFLTYDYNTDEILIKDRLFNYILAKSEQRDYDVIQFNSSLERRDQTDNNATLNLLNYDMTINGIKKIFLSDSHNVFLRPAGRTIILKKNRDFTFSGIINAGRFEFFCRDNSFSYDDFKIDMPNVDSLRLSVEVGQKDEYGRRKRRRVRTVIENITGELLIDRPGNKSGLESLSEYPIFKSLEDSYVFYQRAEVQGGVYKRDNFYFHLEPFVFDSLDNFRKEGIRFDGTFQSAGIFPDFEETLTLQPDYSLGFVRSTPKAGFPIYGGKGTYKKEINMSHEGLRGDGTLKYLTSTAESDDFIFFPDSTNGVAHNLVIEEQMGSVQFPPVTGADIYLHWEPYRDQMALRNTKEPFIFYDGNSNLDGNLNLQPSGLLGGGLFAFAEAELESEEFKFEFSEFFADTADFRLKTKNDNLDQLSFSTNNVDAHIDFANRKGEFVSNGGGSYVNFPVNQYIAYMDRFTWYMDDDQIELSAGKGKTKSANELAFEGSRFISTHPKQDSLDFYSVAARYDLASHIINAKKVEFISVADALIYPRDGNVVIEAKAKMQPLDSSSVVANSITKYHKLYNTNINVYGKRNYAGSGYYDYVDIEKNKQTIHFTTLSVDTAAQTYGTGTILEEEAFTLSPKFEYKGDIRLEASNKFLSFKGNTRIFHDCENLSRPWVRFTAEIDPEEIYIPIDSSLRDENGGKLASSVMINRDSIHLYSTFASPLKRRNDYEVLPAFGFMVFDTEANEYKISNLSKLNTPSLPGNLLSLHTSYCRTYAEGKLDFAANLGRVEVTPVGNINHSFDDDKLSFDLMMLIDFFMAPNAMDKMAKAITSYPDLKPVNFERQVFERGLYELVEKKDADKLISQVALSGQFRKFPNELNKTLFLSEVKMKWNPETSSYVSYGQIGLGSIFKEQVHKMVDGRIEIIKKRSGDIINIYIELDRKNWYFFSYRSNLMQAISSDAEFNNVIKEMKSDKRKLKPEKGKAPYSFIMSSERKKTEFLRKFDSL